MTIDYTLPAVAGITPSPAAGTLSAGTGSLAIQFSEAMANAGSAANYKLQSAGADGLLGTADDVIIAPTVTYAGKTATLKFAGLAENVYRLTLLGSLADLAGNGLDGNGDGEADSFVDDFVVVNDGLFGNPTTFTTGAYPPYRLIAADFNGDGNSDLALTNFSGAISVLLGNGSGGFGAATNYSTGGYYAYGIAAGDFNGDGKTDWP